MSTKDAPRFDSIAPSKFYVSGLSFARHDDGTVEIDGPGLVIPIQIEPMSWASVVAFLSARGDNTDTFAEARRLHEYGAALATTEEEG